MSYSPINQIRAYQTPHSPFQVAGYAPKTGKLGTYTLNYGADSAGSRTVYWNLSQSSVKSHVEALKLFHAFGILAAQNAETPEDFTALSERIQQMRYVVDGARVTLIEVDPVTGETNHLEILLPPEVLQEIGKTAALYANIGPSRGAPLPLSDAEFKEKKVEEINQHPHLEKLDQAIGSKDRAQINASINALENSFKGFGEALLEAARGLKPLDRLTPKECDHVAKKQPGLEEEADFTALKALISSPSYDVAERGRLIASLETTHPGVEIALRREVAISSLTGDHFAPALTEYVIKEAASRGEILGRAVEEAINESPFAVLEDQLSKPVSERQARTIRQIIDGLEKEYPGLTEELKDKAVGRDLTALSIENVQNALSERLNGLPQEERDRVEENMWYLIGMPANTPVSQIDLREVGLGVFHVAYKHRSAFSPPLVTNVDLAKRKWEERGGVFAPLLNELDKSPARRNFIQAVDFLNVHYTGIREEIEGILPREKWKQELDELVVREALKKWFNELPAAEKGIILGEIQRHFDEDLSREEQLKVFSEIKEICHRADESPDLFITGEQQINSTPIWFLPLGFFDRVRCETAR